jgi:glycine/D-amino acid oxidase-like deaminating enzyme
MPHTVIVGAGIIGVCTAYYLSSSASYNRDHAITIIDQSPPASGASGKAAGFLARHWTGSVTAPLEELSFQLHYTLAQQYDGEQRWGYRPCQVLAVMGGETRVSGPANLQWNERQRLAMRSPYLGDLRWVKPDVIASKTILGDPDSFAQW